MLAPVPGGFSDLADAFRAALFGRISAQAPAQPSGRCAPTAAPSLHLRSSVGGSEEELGVGVTQALCVLLARAGEELYGVPRSF